MQIELELGLSQNCDGRLYGDHAERTVRKSWNSEDSFRVVPVALGFQTDKPPMALSRPSPTIGYYTQFQKQIQPFSFISFAFQSESWTTKGAPFEIQGPCDLACVKERKQLYHLHQTRGLYERPGLTLASSL